LTNGRLVKGGGHTAPLWECELSNLSENVSDRASGRPSVDTLSEMISPESARF
jgi:hypothetical protein